MRLPIKPIFLLADSRPLFADDDPERSLLRAVRRQVDEGWVKAAYIGAANGDEPAFYEIFEAAMARIAVRTCRHVRAGYGETDQAFLREADIVLLAGGDVAEGWRVIESTGMQQHLIEAYYRGAVLLGVSAGAVHLGLRGQAGEKPGPNDHFPCLQLVPYAVDAHDEMRDWLRLRALIDRQPRLRGLGLPTGASARFDHGGLLEPLDAPLVEFMHRSRWDDAQDGAAADPDAQAPPAEDESGLAVVQSLLLPSPVQA
ncbi:MAG: Type 1 glutamine amidotransferase-like domain-containing protein [Acidobacteriota bacterium]